MRDNDSIERQLEGLFGFSRAVLFGRARSALVALLETLGAHGRLPVLLPSNICPAVLTAICGAGADPRLVPVSPLNGLPTDAAFAQEIDRLGRGGVAMVTHLYGFWQPYPLTRAAALQHGWFVLENDSLAVTARLDSAAPYRGFGDALLVSFGYAKTLEIGVGGALLTDDVALAATLAHQVERLPLIDDAAVAAETKFNELRRRYRQPPYPQPGLAENLLAADLKELRYGFPLGQSESLRNGIAALSETVRRRRDRAERWQLELGRLGGRLLEPDLAPLVPWRVIRRVPQGRDQLVARLRKHGFDAGTNFPPLTDSFPNLLAGQRQADAQCWADQVLNLWVSDDYDDARIRRAVDLMEQSDD